MENKQLGSCDFYFFLNYCFLKYSLFAIEIHTHSYVPSIPKFFCGIPVAFKYRKRQKMPAWIMVSPRVLIS